MAHAITKGYAQEVKHMKLKEGALVKHYRTKKNISQTKLAQEVGVGQSYISEIEAGAKTPSVPVLKKLCNLLGFTVDEYLEGKKVGK